jgi:hypothetical protein
MNGLPPVAFAGSIMEGFAGREAMIATAAGFPHVHAFAGVVFITGAVWRARHQ